MNKFNNYIKKAILLGLISIVGYIGSGRGTDMVYASGTESQLRAEAVSGQAITVENKEVSALYPVPVTVDGDTKYGYIDNTGKIVLKPVYELAYDYSEGYASVLNGKYQIINLKGDVVFESTGYISNFHNGLAAFSDPNHNYDAGYINTKGKVVIQPKYRFAGDFRTNHTAIVADDNNYYVIDETGKVLRTYKLKTQYTIYDTTDDGYLIVTDPNTYLKGVIHLNGKVILKPIYGEVTYLNNGLFGVKKKLPDIDMYLLSTKPSAIFNKNGKPLTPYKFYDLSVFQNGYASATDDKTTYFINKSGKKITTLPILEGRGTMVVYDDIIEATIDSDLSYLKKDGTVIWGKSEKNTLPSGITVNTVKVRPNKYVVVAYPQLDGISDDKVEKKINNELKTIFTKERIDIKLEDYYSVNDNFTVEQIKDLLVINRTGYDYPIGAAHGVPINLYYFIDVKTGEFYKFNDLFKNNSDYLTKLSKIVKQKIQEPNETGYFFNDIDSNSLVTKDQFFYISKDTLTIYYDSGAIAAYAAGFPKFDIPFKDIMNLINTDGSFWKSFQNTGN